LPSLIIATGEIVVDHGGELGPVRGDDRDGQRSRGLRPLEGREHVGRAAARTDADDCVARGHADFLDRARTGASVVLGGLSRLTRQPGSCDERDDLARLRREGRLALVGVEGRDRTGGARPDVDQPTARAEALDDRVDRGGELPRNRADGRRHGRVLAVHQLDELARRAHRVVDVLPARLGDEAFQAGSSLARRHWRSLSVRMVGGQYQLRACSTVVLLFG
jgi:hypothetical protein